MPVDADDVPSITFDQHRWVHTELNTGGPFETWLNSGEELGCRRQLTPKEVAELAETTVCDVEHIVDTNTGVTTEDMLDIAVRIRTEMPQATTMCLLSAVSNWEPEVISQSPSVWVDSVIVQTLGAATDRYEREELAQFAPEGVAIERVHSTSYAYMKFVPE